MLLPSYSDTALFVQFFMSRSITLHSKTLGNCQHCIILFTLLCSFLRFLRTGIRYQVSKSNTNKRVRVDLGVIAMKRYSKLTISLLYKSYHTLSIYYYVCLRRELSSNSELKHHHQMLFSLIPRTHFGEGIFHICRGYFQHILNPFNR